MVGFEGSCLLRAVLLAGGGRGVSWKMRLFCDGVCAASKAAVKRDWRVLSKTPVKRAIVLIAPTTSPVGFVRTLERFGAVFSVLRVSSCSPAQAKGWLTAHVMVGFIPSFPRCACFAYMGRHTRYPAKLLKCLSASASGVPLVDVVNIFTN